MEEGRGSSAVDGCFRPSNKELFSGGSQSLFFGPAAEALLGNLFQMQFLKPQKIKINKKINKNLNSGAGGVAFCFQKSFR